MKSYKDKKVISIGEVSAITGLTTRKIRYYEERNLVFPKRTAKGTRKFSFMDVERLMLIAEQMEDGLQILEIKEEMLIKQHVETREGKNKVRIGQLNSHFHLWK